MFLGFLVFVEFVEILVFVVVPFWVLVFTFRVNYTLRFDVSGRKHIQRASARAAPSLVADRVAVVDVGNRV